MAEPNILKLNFDGSFVREFGRGGNGGVVRDSGGSILSSFSAPVDCSDSNGAEVYAMLIAYSEL